MEATALSVGKSVLNGAIGYAKSTFAVEVALQLGIQKDHAFVTDELEMMRSFMMEAHVEGESLDSKDSKGHQNYKRQWLTRLKDLDRFRPSKEVILYVLCLCVCIIKRVLSRMPESRMCPS